MNASVALALLVLAASGCSTTRNVTQAKITLRAGTNTVEITQPKDTTVGRLEFDPATGKLVLERYASTVNAGAVEAARAESEATIASWREIITTLKVLGVVAGKSQGLDLSDAVSPAVTAPRGYKLVPIDDPSTPQLEIAEPTAKAQGSAVGH